MTLISVVIPTYNRAELLDRAIASVLAQHGNDFEVVVSDNCSTDQTVAMVGKYLNDSRIRYSRNESNIGMVGNWKKAIQELASGEWFLLLSDDDYLLDKNYLSKVARAIREYDPVFVYAGGEVHDVPAGTAHTLTLPFNGPVSGLDVFKSRGTVKPQDIILCSMVFRRSDADRLGFLDNPNNLSCDSEFYLKLCVEGNVYVVDGKASAYIKHGDNLVDTINKNRRLRDRNLDHLINPYRYAKEKGVSSKILAAFRRHAQMDRNIINTLLLLRLHSELWYRECRARVLETVPEVLDEIEHSLEYLVKLFFITFGRLVLKRIFPISDSRFQ